MMDLPRERQPDPALEERVVSALVASGLIRRRRSRAPVWLAAAALVVLTIGLSVWRTRHAAASRNTYVLLLYEDSTYRHALPGHGADRVAELSRWADSLAALDQLDLGGHLVGSTAPGGLFIIRAASDSGANHIAASCPFLKYGGRIDVRRFIQ